MRFIAKSILFLIGWRMDTKNPAHQRCVLIAAPHTSNWDFLMMMLFSAAFGVKTKWMGKKNLFIICNSLSLIMNFFINFIKNSIDKLNFINVMK